MYKYQCENLEVKGKGGMGGGGAGGFKGEHTTYVDST
jgi:hypothetical protein